jgi:aubergine-like protein
VINKQKNYKNVYYFSEALMKYKAKNGTLPTSIVVYRDGVGEGQISHVHNTEIRLLQVGLLKLFLIY